MRTREEIEQEILTLKALINSISAQYFNNTLRGDAYHLMMNDYNTQLKVLQWVLKEDI